MNTSSVRITQLQKQCQQQARRLQKQSNLTFSTQAIKRLRRYERQLQRLGVVATLGFALLGVTTKANGQVLPIGNEFRINTYTTNRQYLSSVAVDSSGDFVVIWNSDGQDGSLSGVYGQLYNNNGNKVGSEFRVNTYTTFSQYATSVAMDYDGDFVVVWSSNQQSSDNDVYGQRYENYSKAGSEFRVNTYTTNTQNDPSVAMDSDGDFVIVWQSGYFAINSPDESYSGIYGQRYDKIGNKVGDQFRIDSGFKESNPNVAMNDNGDFVVVWEDIFFEDGSETGIYGQRYNRNGMKEGGQFLVNTYTRGFQSNPSVAIDSDGAFMVVWKSKQPVYFGSYGIYGQVYKSDGTLNGSEFRVSNYTTSDQGNQSIAVNADGNFIVVWDSSYREVFGQVFSSDGVPYSTEFPVNTFTTGIQGKPYIASNADGDVVVVWESEDDITNIQDGSRGGIYGQRFSVQDFAIICENDINLLNTIPIVNTDYRAENTITSQQVLPTDFIINYKATNSIRLQPGFHAQKGIVFRANLEPIVCNAVVTSSLEIRETHSVANRTTPKTTQIYPNPVDNQLLLSLKSTTVENGKLSILNLNGQVLIQREIQLVEGENVSSIDVSSLVAGSYFLQLESVESAKVLRFVKL